MTDKKDDQKINRSEDITINQEAETILDRSDLEPTLVNPDLSDMPTLTPEDDLSETLTPDGSNDPTISPEGNSDPTVIMPGATSRPPSSMANEELHSFADLGMDETRMVEDENHENDETIQGEGTEVTAILGKTKSGDTRMNATELPTLGGVSQLGDDMGETMPLERTAADKDDSNERTASGSRLSEGEQTLPMATRHKAKTKVVDPIPNEVPEKHKQYLVLLGKTLDGYYIESLLGAGGMGAVYLAHQTSLDRKVAIKILPEKFAHNPKLLARFTREALSAAQMNHHNVMSVIDVGKDKGVHYISLEYVKGQSLGDIIRKEGRLNVDDAAGYILQACRGLAYAHERGMVHRDIKPDNLMVNEHGIVKIADMGLAKMNEWAERPVGMDHNEDLIKASAMAPDLTAAEIAMGTPAYMSPEQARDTASVDSRADQYSLGCTLYYLCAGQAPYTGTTAHELMSKHMHEPIVPITTHIKSVPPAFKTILDRMLKKDPKDRYPSLKEAAKDIENYLGLDSEKGPYRPREHHLQALEESQSAYYAAPALKLRKIAMLSFFLLMPLLFILVTIIPFKEPENKLSAFGIVLGLWIMTPLFGFLVDGVKNKTALFRRSKSALFGMPWKNWAAGVLSVVLVGLLLYFFGWIWLWVGTVVISVCLVMGYQIGVIRPLAIQRQPALDKMQEIFRELRLKGVSEEALQDFVARFTGTHWEEFFEEFFGYDAMIEARGKGVTSDKVTSRKKFATWRDPLANWLDGIEKARKEARERTQLQTVEAGVLVADGVSKADAKKQAEEEVDKLFASGLLATLEEDRKRWEEKRRFRVRLPIGNILRIVRGAGGLAMVAAFIAWRMGDAVPQALQSILLNFYSFSAYGENLSYLHAFPGLVAGCLLILSAFSKRFFAANLAFIGAALVTFCTLISQISQQAPPQTLMLAGLAVMAISMGYCILAKLTGGKF